MSRNVELTETDVQVLQAWLDGWDDNELWLPGGLSYQKVIDLVRKLGLEMPPELQDVESGAFEKRMAEWLKSGPRHEKA